MSKVALRLPAPWVTVLLQIVQSLSGQGVLVEARRSPGSNTLILLQFLGSMQDYPHLPFLMVQYLRVGKEHEVQHCSLRFSWMLPTTKHADRAISRQKTKAILLIFRSMISNQYLLVIADSLQIMNSLNCRFIGEYEKGEMIGEGTYGIVFFAKDKNSNEQLAIKKMKVLDNQDGFPITSLREVKILKMLCNHPNIVSLKEVVVGLKAESVFLVFQYCEIDLYKLLNQMMIDKSSFSQAEIKCLCLQLIKGVSYAHSKYIIHRDLKLTNLLLNKKGILKIADFGLARQFEKPHRPLTRKVVTLWYRAPELLLKIKEYGKAVDVWSIGCIIAEFLRQGLPLFQGNSQIHQFQTICQVIGYPTKENWPQFFEQSKSDFRKQVQKLCGNRKNNNISHVFKGFSDKCIDLLTKMLCWDPYERISLQQALGHPYFIESPKALFPDEIKVLNRLEFYSKKSNEDLNKKKK